MGHQRKADIILHPVRLRILVALGGTELTAQQLVRLLPDVPQTTLYRQLNLLTWHGVLEVADERRVRGTVERVYRPALGTTSLTPGDLAEAPAEDHLRYFSAFTTALLADFARYVGARGRIDVGADGVLYTKATLYLSEEELRAFQTAAQALLGPLLAQEPRPDRRPHLLALAHFPLLGQAPDAEPDHPQRPEDAWGSSPEPGRGVAARRHRDPGPDTDH